MVPITEKHTCVPKMTLNTKDNQTCNTSVSGIYLYIILKLKDINPANFMLQEDISDFFPQTVLYA